MQDFTKKFLQIEQKQRRIDKANERIEKIKKELKLLKEEIFSICMPPCLKAIEEYNLNHPLKIIPDEIQIRVDPSEKKIYIFVMLCDEKGCQPRDEFEEEDTKGIEDYLRPIIKKELKQKGIPLSFGKLSVPSSYYTK